MSEQRRILVVDDERIVTQSCKRILSAEGYEVETTQSGTHGLSLAREGGYDLLMTDLKMPDLDGMEIVQTIRRERAEMSVVIITGYGTAETRIQARDLGVMEYVEKPFSPDQLTDAVLSAWAHTETDAAAAQAVPEEVRQLAARYEHHEDALIQMLLDTQQAKGYLPREYLFGISTHMGIPLNRVYQAASFYKAFSLEPTGEHMVQVCTGTACHVRGAPALVARVQEQLGVPPGKTTGDGTFTLETVNCLGCCALGPVLAIDDQYYSKPTPDKIVKILDSYRQEVEAT